MAELCPGCVLSQWKLSRSVSARSRTISRSRSWTWRVVPPACSRLFRLRFALSLHFQVYARHLTDASGTFAARIKDDSVHFAASVSFMKRTVSARPVTPSPPPPRHGHTHANHHDRACPSPGQNADTTPMS